MKIINSGQFMSYVLYRQELVQDGGKSISSSVVSKVDDALHMAVRETHEMEMWLVIVGAKGQYDIDNKLVERWVRFYMKGKILRHTLEKTHQLFDRVFGHKE